MVTCDDVTWFINFTFTYCSRTILCLTVWSSISVRVFHLPASYMVYQAVSLRVLTRFLNFFYHFRLRHDMSPSFRVFAIFFSLLCNQVMIERGLSTLPLILDQMIPSVHRHQLYLLGGHLSVHPCSYRCPSLDVRFFTSQLCYMVCHVVSLVSWRRCFWISLPFSST